MEITRAMKMPGINMQITTEFNFPENMLDGQQKTIFF